MPSVCMTSVKLQFEVWKLLTKIVLLQLKNFLQNLSKSNKRIFLKANFFSYSIGVYEALYNNC